MAGSIFNPRKRDAIITAGMASGTIQQGVPLPPIKPNLSLPSTINTPFPIQNMVASGAPTSGQWQTFPVAETWDAEWNEDQAKTLGGVTVVGKRNKKGVDKPSFFEKNKVWFMVGGAALLLYFVMKKKKA